LFRLPEGCKVLVNLLTNAIKYSPQADTVMVRVGRDGQKAIVSVQDFGEGRSGSQAKCRPDAHKGHPYT